MKKAYVIKKLRNDEHYFGDFGKEYLSTSDIKTLLTNPLALGKAGKLNLLIPLNVYFAATPSICPLLLLLFCC